MSTHSRIVDHIEGKNVRPSLPEIMEPIVALAKVLDDVLYEGPEKQAALRKLLECTDAAVRCRLADMENQVRDMKVRAASQAISNLSTGVSR